MLLRSILTGLVLYLFGLPTAVGAGAGQVILDEGSSWRMFAAWNTPVVRKGTELVPDSGSRGYFAACTAPPPADWMRPEFVDGSWSRWSLSRQRRREYDYGFAPAWGAPGPTLSLMCLRGRFAVKDPARVRGLHLSLAYRGGVVVYVNGREVARAHLPKDGKIEPTTVAEDYPSEAFVHPEVIRGSKCILAEFGQPGKYRDQLEKRIRRLEDVPIDPELLRKGVNVLAVELHRAAYFGEGLEKEGLNHESVWSTAGLVSLALKGDGAVEPNTSRPPGVQVWACAEMRRPSPAEYADPLEEPGPVQIVGCLNGAFNGKVMVSSDKALSGLKAQVSDLKHKDGNALIPAAAVRPFYTVRDDRMAMRYGVPQGGFWDSLSEEPPATVEVVPGMGACQAVLLKVRVPADAAPGDYAGKLTVSAEGLPPTDVPLELRVLRWKLPDPKDFVTHMGIIQSPDSVALQYGVPLWSEEHWKYLEESFRLLGELGNNYVVVPIISRTNFGNQEGMIRWVRDGDGYRYDFTIFERYLDLGQKYQRVDVVCLYVWDWYVGYRYWGRGEVVYGWRSKESGPKVTLWDPQTGRCEDLEGPRLWAPEARDFFRPVCEEIVSRMARRGLTEATMLGISGDARAPTKEMMENLRAVMPGAKWVANPHGDVRGGTMHATPIGYNTQYYMNLCPPPGTALARYGAVNGRFYGWQSTTDYYGRSRGPTAPLSLWRGSVEAALVHNCSGLGRIGADFWPVLLDRRGHEKDLFVSPQSQLSRSVGKHSASVAARYPESSWDQLNLDRGTEALFAPGPRGAVPTERSEQVRLGIQECEARIFIEKAILANKLDPKLARKCQDVLDQRVWHIRGLGACGGAGGAALGGPTLNTWYEGAGSAGLPDKLFTAAEEVAADPGER